MEKNVGKSKGKAMKIAAGIIAIVLVAGIFAFGTQGGGWFQGNLRVVKPAKVGTLETQKLDALRPGLISKIMLPTESLINGQNDLFKFDLKDGSRESLVFNLVKSENLELSGFVLQKLGKDLSVLAEYPVSLVSADTLLFKGSFSEGNYRVKANVRGALRGSFTEVSISGVAQRLSVK